MSAGSPEAHEQSALPRARIKGAMADSVFWRDLADQFVKLQNKLLAGSKITRLTYKTLDGLAIRGASKIALPDTPSPNLLLLWHTAVRKEDPAFRSLYRDKEGMSLAEHEQNFEIGGFDDICQNSATFCRRLENRALQAEFEKKHRNAAETSQSTEQTSPAATFIGQGIPVEAHNGNGARQSLAVRQAGMLKAAPVAGVALHKPGQVELGRWAEQRLEEMRKFANMLRGGKSPTEIRPQFVTLFTEVIDRLTVPRRESLFDQARCRLMRVPDLMDWIADVKQLKATTLADYRKMYRREIGIMRSREWVGATNAQRDRRPPQKVPVTP